MADWNWQGLGQSLGMGGAGLGAIVGQNIMENRMAKKLNPMRQALLETQPYNGPMASPESQQAAQQVQSSYTPEQAVVMRTAQDPRLFARLAQTPEGALALASVMKRAQGERDLVVHAGDELDKRYGLGLQPGEAATITKKYDANDHEIPGWTLKAFHAKAGGAGGGEGGSAAMKEVKAVEDRVIAEGGKPFTAQQYDAALAQHKETAKDPQMYNKARNQYAAEHGGDASNFPPFEAWTPGFTAAVRVGEKGTDIALTHLDELQKTANLASQKLETLKVGNDLLASGAMNTGSTASQRNSIGRLMDTLLDRPPQENASAYTDAYLANSGRAVGQTIRLFGAGTGLSDADREYAKLIAGGDVTMTPEALRLIMEINTRGALGDIKRYNDAHGALAQDQQMGPLVGRLFQPIGINEDTQMPPLQKAPAGLSPQQKVEFYLKQRPSYAPAQGATPSPGNAQLPPTGAAPGGVAPQGAGAPGAGIIRYDATGKRLP